MSDQSAPEGNAPEPEEKTPEGPPEWLTPIQERMEQQHELMGQMADAISGLYYEGDEDEDAEGFEEEPPYEDDGGELSPEAARRIIGSEVDQRVEARFAAQQAERLLIERNDAFEALQDEIPALQDDKYARELVQEAAQWLREHRHESGIETPMIVDVIEQLHYRRGAMERNAAEREQAPDVVLESGSGAAPQQKTEEDWGDRIVKAAESLRPTI